MLSASKAPHAPLARGHRLRSSAARDSIAASSAAGSSGAHAAQREHDLGGVVDVGVVVVRELKGPAADGELGPADRPVAADAHLLAEQPGGAAAQGAGSSGGRPASARAITASAVSQTGDWQASSQRASVAADQEAVEALERPRAITGWSRG